MKKLKMICYDIGIKNKEANNIFIATSEISIAISTINEG